MSKKEPLNITPGEAIIVDGTFMYVLNNGTPPQNRMWAQVQKGRNNNGDWVSGKEVEANAALYADAHNTYNRTQLLPSEMAERIKALEDEMRRLAPVLYSLETEPKHWNEHTTGTGIATLNRLRALLTTPNTTDHG